MRFVSHLERNLRWRKGYVEERTGVRNLRGVNGSLRLHPLGNVPITALHSSRVRSNLYEWWGQRIGEGEGVVI